MKGAAVTSLNELATLVHRVLEQDRPGVLWTASDVEVTALSD